MAYTTTATTTYSLMKYSRSYPAGNSSSVDWQHFTNPVLRLILDVTKTEKSELCSVRIKVVWTIQNGGIITVNDKSEIEDVDLLAFSSIQPKQGAPMNVPLKAVYRDTTVGIRYLHPLDATNTTMFRRFQISFATEQDTNAFIHSIQGVCPCKMSPGPAARQQRQMPAPPVSGTMSSSIGNNNVLTAPLQEGQYPFGSVVLETQPSTGRVIQKSIPIQGTASNVLITTPSRGSSMPPPPMPSQNLHRSTSSLDLNAIDGGSQNTFPSASAQQSSSQTYTAPSSSQVSVRQEVVDVEKVAHRDEREKTIHPFIASLKEATSIYDLPPDVLELAVGDVIREDGFVSLVSDMADIVDA
ncbi:hypothetical protein AN958_03063 [Leucoagaricus sp. SymC.cos]|nr:hypothetical protein AN958_03063 [Leucoagaricus sp. SymC.cos]